MKNITVLMASLLVSVTSFASFTQTPQPAPSNKPTPISVYSCDEGTILLSVRGNVMKGDYSLELKNATIDQDKGLNGTSDPGDCTKVLKQEVTAIAVPVCNVATPSGNNYQLAFSGFEGQINTVSIVGQPNATAVCQLVQ